jgi:glycosyltransferase involved in cell wall biosynthesis
MPTRGIVRSTDRRYIYERFVRLAEHHPIEFLPNNSLLSFGRVTARHLASRLRALAALPLGPDRVVVRMRVPRDAHAVFSYGVFPDDRTSPAPIVWEQTFAPTSLDVREEDLVRTLLRERSWAVERASAIVTATQVSADWVRRVFPAARDRVHWIPYYMPGLEPANEEATSAKFHSAGPLRILFVGKQGRRKGLDTLVAAYEALPAPVQRDLEVTVVSPMLDGAVRLPRTFRYERTVPDIFALMRTAHVLAFPTKHEAFGLVLVEAMANGCAIVTTRAPIQQSIVGEDGGLFVDPRIALELRDALAELAADRARARAMAVANVRRFAASWHHGVVGDRYTSLLRGAAAGTVTHPRA